MNYSKEEKAIAKNLVSSAETVKLLEKIFTPEVEPLEPQLENACLSMSDAEYGQNQKALAIAKASFRTKMNALRNLGSGKEPSITANAPR